MSPLTEPPDRAKVRVERARGAVTALRRAMSEWNDSRTADPRFGRFLGHLRALREVLGMMLDAIDQELLGIRLEEAPSGEVYVACRAAEQRLSLVRRTHEWYAGKYDQRLDPLLSQVLLAADELVRSCWVQPFQAAGCPPPPGPLVYLDPRFDAGATPRVSVPSDLRAPSDAVIGTFVRQLPIPVIALPATCVEEPWWLVLAAHETGHHVQLELEPTGGGLLQSTAAALHAAAAEDAERADEWVRWGREAFADVFSVLTVGRAAAWAVDELQHAPLRRLVSTPSAGDRYPPPLVRHALLAETAAQAGLAGLGPDLADLAGLLDEAHGAVDETARTIARRHLDLVPRVVRALLDLDVRNRPLREVCAAAPSAHGPGGEVAYWAARLTRPAPSVSGRATWQAARSAAAAAVRVVEQRAAADGPDQLMRLRENLPVLLASTGPAGVLAPDASVDLSDVRERLLNALTATQEGVDP